MKMQVSLVISEAKQRAKHKAYKKKREIRLKMHQYSINTLIFKYLRINSLIIFPSLSLKLHSHPQLLLVIPMIDSYFFLINIFFFYKNYYFSFSSFINLRAFCNFLIPSLTSLWALLEPGITSLVLAWVAKGFLVWVWILSEVLNKTYKKIIPLHKNKIFIQVH